MIRVNRISRDESGAAVIEMAFALPVLLMMIWMVVQLGMVLRAMAGIEHALGEGARAATIWPVPSKNDITAIMNNTVYGIGPGSFSIPAPQSGTADGSDYLDLQVTYTQSTNLIFLPGPTLTVSRSKRVWVADDA
jgi:Flp pilus assembly protein TadG